MNNKKVKLGALVLAAVTVFTATAFAASSENEGYEALKQIMKDSRETTRISGASFNGTFQITDNGKIIADMKGEAKADKDDKKSSGKVQVDINGKEQDLSFYQNGKDVYLTDDTNTKYYKVVDAEHKSESRYKEYDNKDYNRDHKMGKAEEALIDYLVGDLKSQIELTKNSDGTKTFTMDLNQNEIPIPVNLLTAVAVENSNYDHDSEKAQIDQAQEQLMMTKFPFLKNFCNKDQIVPSLKQNVKINALVFKLTVDSGNQIKSFGIKSTIAGEDAQGAFHEITFQGSAAISDINNTSIDSFNADGKNVEIIDAKDFKKDCNGK